MKRSRRSRLLIAPIPNKTEEKPLVHSGFSARDNNNRFRLLGAINLSGDTALL